MVLGVLLRVGAAVAAIAAVAWKAKVPRRLGRARAGPCLENRTYDVIVVGGGVMGVWTAIAAKRQAERRVLL